VHQHGENIVSAIQKLRLDKIEEAQKQTIERITNELKIKGKEVEEAELVDKLRNEKLINVSKRS